MSQFPGSYLNTVGSVVQRCNYGIHTYIHVDVQIEYNKTYR